jgi:hypothetical protein
MATSTTETLSRSDVARLDRLILACNDGARAQAAAALIVGGSRADRLEEAAARRASFADELAEMIRLFGGKAEPRSTGSTSVYETIRAAIHGVNSLIIGENAGDAYGSCARIEAKTEKLYARTSCLDLPRAVIEVMIRHHLEISADHAELRRLS